MNRGTILFYSWFFLSPFLSPLFEIDFYVKSIFFTVFLTTSLFEFCSRFALPFFRLQVHFRKGPRKEMMFLSLLPLLNWQRDFLILFVASLIKSLGIFYIFFIDFNTYLDRVLLVFIDRRKPPLALHKNFYTDSSSLSFLPSYLDFSFLRLLNLSSYLKFEPIDFVLSLATV